VASQLPAFSLVFTDGGTVLGLLLSALLIVLIGVADDIWDLDWYTKLAGQLLAAGLLAWIGSIQLVMLPAPGVIVMTSPTLSLAVTVILVVLVMNAVNFIDGLDGLVAGVALIANGVFFFYAYRLSTGDGAETEYFNLGSLIAAVVMGACLGFLPLNWRRSDARPARLFMGDAGALLIGLLMAASTIAVTGSLNTNAVVEQPGGVAIPLGGSGLLPSFIPVLLPFFVLIVPAFDFSLAVLRRLRAGKSPFSADRKHLHHRLLDMGHSHLHAVLIFYAWTLVVALGCLAYMFIPAVWATLLIVAGLLICTIVTLSPLSRRKALEAVAQSTDPAHETADVARYDQLDVASTGPVDIHSLQEDPR
jgi:UDP-GlcNAc:undecaprenyl-phosphate/decaprenyl-phosphate GlcNAc-1-phosphate transferase